ncbi:5'-methylthioadenosine/S-adenosylhomocysteine nucleosidase [Acuticoccus sp. M5D2P5]|uniref:5'-methylthioadenosine/S-adenosylhomocysteine nucleosidase n=1 Tax=Acuticoccus kalidii TaxID=2910977 RepID=UPI001F325A3E|nr:5'-methylthioadenosine/S-adenosylhomocysteine nucleosidase [Acuticoccus kalidii]MCF3935814.1 5'-methylthioadenosine/S-adenosylhomocysteine nucleosidase [Acuticoccus kalidii]
MPTLTLRAVCATAAMLFAAGPTVAAALDDTPRIAILSAFEPEWVALQDGVEAREEIVEHGIRYVTGRLEGEEVVLLLSGVGMVNAAMTTQMALDRFEITAIVFSGIAGGIDPSLSIGDVVVPEAWGPYFNVLIAREGEGGAYALPSFYDAPFANYGMIFPQPEEVRREGAEEPEDVFWFAADPALLEAAKEAAESFALARCSSDTTCLGKTPEVIVGGNGVSGSAFVDNADFRRYVFDTFEARVVDMESAAVAQVAYTNSVPFIAFRSLSDLAGGGEGENELPVFFALAAQNSADLVRAFLRVEPKGDANGAGSAKDDETPRPAE